MEKAREERATAEDGEDEEDSPQAFLSSSSARLSASLSSARPQPLPRKDSEAESDEDNCDCEEKRGGASQRREERGKRLEDMTSHAARRSEGQQEAGYEQQKQGPVWYAESVRHDRTWTPLFTLQPNLISLIRSVKLIAL
jgi:hypothetical protein